MENEPKESITVYRDPNTWRLRKWQVVYCVGSSVVDRRYMFGGMGFARRLARKIRRMVKMRDIADYVIDKTAI